MAARALPVEEVLALLRAAPDRLAAVAGRGAGLHEAPAPGEWSANEVLAHLRSCADVWGGCIERILAEDHPTIRAVNPRTWIESTDYLALDFATSLAAFTAQRSALLARLSPLPPAAWERSAAITGAGRPLERTVLDYARWLATHERPHLRQVERAAGL